MFKLLRIKNALGRIHLKTRFIVLFAGIIAISLIMYAIWSNYTQQKQAINEMKEKAYALSRQMDAVWEFMSIHQDRINYDADGSYNFKGLHCSLVGKSIGKLFGYTTNYITRYVNHNPRNSDDMPDQFESDALYAFKADDQLFEIYKLTNYDDMAMFRYMKPMYINQSCLECHGDPAGEIDVTGFPKEGWKIGDLAGALSIIMPVDTYMMNKRSNITQEVAFFSMLMITFILIIYFATTVLVTRPLNKLKDVTEEIRAGNINANVNMDAIGMRGGEITDLAEHFDAMIRELRTVNNDLENKVNLRTQDLAHANEILEKQQEQLEKINRQLLTDNEYKSDFMAIMSHELRTPLTSIIACADVMYDTVHSLKGDERKMLSEIRHNSQILYSLINNILDMARIEAGKTELVIEDVDFVDVLNAVKPVILPLADKKNIKVKSEIANDVPLMEGDREKLRRIVENLMSNAVKFTNVGGEVKVAVTYAHDSDSVIVQVEDNGIGIKKEEQELIFQKFVQGDSSIYRPYSGSGLGLALTRELVELHKGAITVKSEFGAGSVFLVVLPVRAGGIIAMKIMLVDDEESIKIPIEVMVANEGYDFCYAANGEDALRMFFNEKPDLVLLDVMLGSMNGFEVCRKIRASSSNVPIIMLTAKGDILDKSVGFRAGADDYIVKPFSSMELMLRIAAHLRRWEREGSAIREAEVSGRYIAGDIELCVKKQEVSVRGQLVELTPTEFKLLDYLASHPDEVFSREKLQEYLWGEHHTSDLTSVAGYIRKIREKIEEEPSSPKYLQTIWGIGYKFTTK